MKHPYDVYPNDGFISVVIPTYCRPFYLDKALETLAEHADMQYEVIVHDDGSRQDFREKLFAMSHHISTLVFNNGLNFGLGESANRCIEMASSKYILFLNDDCFFTKPCLKDLCDVLDHDYVGTVSVAQNSSVVPDAHFSSSGHCLSSNIGRGSTIAFRKSVWKEVGGFDDRCPSGQADNVFLYKIMREGYWRAMIAGGPHMKIGNFVYNEDYSPTHPFTKGNDCSIPKIFGLPYDDWVLYNNYRRESCQWWVDGERTIPDRHTYEGVSFDGTKYMDTRKNKLAGLNDIPYWIGYFKDIFGGEKLSDINKVNWDVAKRHGQSKWKDQILNDFGIK